MFLEEWGFPVVNEFFKSLAEVFMASVFVSLALVLLLITGVVIIVIAVIWKKTKKNPSTKAKLRAPLLKSKGGSRKR